MQQFQRPPSPVLGCQMTLISTSTTALQSDRHQRLVPSKPLTLLLLHQCSPGSPDGKKDAEELTQKKPLKRNQLINLEKGFLDSTLIGQDI